MSNPQTVTPDALALLSELEARGVELRANGDRLVYDAPRGAIGDLLPDLARFKPQLLELLTRPLDGAGVHRWQSTAPHETGAPDVAALVRELEAARRGIGGAWVIPSPRLLAIWRELQTFIGAKLTARHLGALATLHALNPQLDNTALLDLWNAGLQPDNGDGAPVWRDLALLADETHAAAKAAAKQKAATVET